MTKYFTESIHPNSRKTNLYSPLPGSFFKEQSFHAIEDKLVWDKHSPLDRVRFDPSLSFGERCIEMYKAIMGTHYIERLYLSQKAKQSTQNDASIFSDFCQEDWIFYFIPDDLSVGNAEMFLYLGEYLSIKNENETGDALEDNTIHIRNNADGTISYTLKGLNETFFDTGISLLSRETIPQLIKTMQANGHITNKKKVVQLHNYNRENKTINCKFLSDTGYVVSQTIDLNQLENMINDASDVGPQHKYLYKIVLETELFLQKKIQEEEQSGLGALSNILRREPTMYPLPHAMFKKAILGYLVKSANSTQTIEQYVLDNEKAKGQKGLLDYLIFPLIARNISYNVSYYHNKKIESAFDCSIKFILSLPLVGYIFAVTTMLLEALRIVSAMLLTLICAATIVPILHYQLKHPKKGNEERLLHVAEGAGDLELNLVTGTNCAL